MKILGASGRRGPARISPWVHLFALPALLLYGQFVLYPILTTLLNSFFSFRGINRGAWIGLDNFVTLFTTAPLNERVINAVGNNLIMFAGAMIITFAAFVIAALLHQLTVGREFFKAAFFLPRLLSLVVVGFLWQLILSPRSGALNAFLEAVGLAGLTQAWLGTPDSALTSVIAVGAWHSIGFSILVFLAAMQAIPSNLYEAARLDGAGPGRILFSLTLPLTRSAWMILTVLAFIGAFETFDLVYAMQGVTGAPYYGTDTLGLLFYRLAFGGEGGTAAVGLGSALALAMLVVMAVAAIGTLRLFRPAKD
ncbi:carbohydrate ABC transporter permease [Microlunatus speluncae]|uniref:carbohydrate ABC transporter permease n=1 Tax=Microlunatus speluncae TaxID=2594267 RepID=UPI0012663A74|nr:sugar ABC transporter permease [Microlunatus speluncae]